jgi:glycosyltransferase involved in cell wall biosynthesis
MVMTVLVNLSFIPTKPTGHAVYAQNLIPYLKDLDPILCSAQPVPGFRWQSVSAAMNPDRGTQGHLKRLLWTQFQLPLLYKRLQGRLWFSPIPEAPLFSGCRSVVTLHDFIPLRFPRRSPLALYHRYYIPQVLAQAQHICCDSTATADDAMKFCSIPARKLTVIPLAHAADHFRFLDLPTSNYFLYIGRHDPYKNLQRLLSAFAQLPPAANCQLWLAGPPDPRYTPILEAQAAELGIADRVQFLSYVPYRELPKLLNQAIALVLPSLWEGFGLPVLEAMACGTPVIASNLSSLPEVAGDAALLVDPYQVGEIALAMQALLTETNLHTQLRQWSLARAAQFSWEQTAIATADVLRQYL